MQTEKIEGIASFLILPVDYTLKNIYRYKNKIGQVYYK